MMSNPVPLPRTSRLSPLRDASNGRVNGGGMINSGNGQTISAPGWRRAVVMDHHQITDGDDFPADQDDQVKDFSTIYKEPVEDDDDGQMEDYAIDTVKEYNMEDTPAISHTSSFSDLRKLDGLYYFSPTDSRDDINHNNISVGPGNASTSHRPLMGVSRPPIPYKTLSMGASSSSAKGSPPDASFSDGRPPLPHRPPPILAQPILDEITMPTPIFSRVSPIDFSEFDGEIIKPIDEDVGSVESEFSCEVSKAVSPSDLPASPGEEEPESAQISNIMCIQREQSQYPKKPSQEPYHQQPRAPLIPQQQLQPQQAPLCRPVPCPRRLPRKNPPPIPPKPPSIVSASQFPAFIAPPEEFGSLLPELIQDNQNNNHETGSNHKSNDESKQDTKNVVLASSEDDDDDDDDDDDLLAKCMSKGITAVRSISKPTLIVKPKAVSPQATLSSSSKSMSPTLSTTRRFLETDIDAIIEYERFLELERAKQVS